MKFIVEPEIFDTFPGLRLPVAVVSDLDNRGPRPDVQALWHRAWRAAAEEAKPSGNAQSHPRVGPWRPAMKAAGAPAKKYPSSIESTLRRALKGGEPYTINPLVDFYNHVSLKHFVPAGGFDLEGLSESLELRLTREGDTFQALDEPAATAVEPGEVAYAAGSTVLTRHFVWRQSQHALISTSTRSAFLVAEVLGDLDPRVAEAVLEDFRSGLARYFDRPPDTFLLHAGHPEISW
jgi:DNA/RNA-binding domain of Phe-tRNA-synthetase-like protein